MNVCGMGSVFSKTSRDGTGAVLSDYMMDFIIVVCYAVYAAESSAGSGIIMKESVRY